MVCDASERLRPHVVRLIDQHNPELGKLVDPRGHALDRGERDAVPVGRLLAADQPMRRDPLRDLVPEGAVELIDEFPCAGEDEGAAVWDVLVSEQLGERFRHDDGLAQAGGEDDLTTTGLAECGDEARLQPRSGSP